MSEKRPLEDATEPVAKQTQLEQRGVCHIKPEYIVLRENAAPEVVDDEETATDRMGLNDPKSKKKRGQNKNRDNRQKHEEVRLCGKLTDPASGESCPFGDNCRFEHDVTKYLAAKQADIPGECPVFRALGYCPAGLKCRFLYSHYDADKNLLHRLSEDEISARGTANHEVNHITSENKMDLVKKRFVFEKSDKIVSIIDAFQEEFRDVMKPKKAATSDATSDATPVATDVASEADASASASDAAAPRTADPARLKKKEIYNAYKDTRYFAQEKKALDLHHKKIVSPLTTVGNLPYRRLMRHLGADVTYCEMALTIPLVQGTNSEWALPKAHVSEYPGFGVQIATSKHNQAARACEALAANVSHVSEINLNSGCPIDLLYRQGSGSALMDQPAKMIRILNAMNYTSGDIPITLKMRTGTRDGHPIAHTLVRRLVNETDIAAITLHGRSRQQRYTKEANWEYVSQVAGELRDEEAKQLDNKDGRDSKNRIQFVGNGDVYNFEDWYEHTKDQNIDSVMVARGALIKPWIFEEVEAQQHLDKSATERLEIIKTYCDYAMQHWGTDEYGIATCRRFMCEFMSFFHRYIPIGILERYPVQMNERPPFWKGRNELETMLGSTDYKDWIKISEMFLGPVNDGFVFTPKHKSNSYN